MDVIGQFSNAMEQSGLTVPERIEADGALHRFPTNGKPNDDSGWYVLYTDGIPAGAFGCWREGRSETWCAELGREMTEIERRADRERIQALSVAREAEKIKRHKESANQAAEIWRLAQPGDHPYLTSKGVKGYGLRVHGGSLIIPMYDGRKLWSLQFIGPDGSKRFHAGGRMSGCYFPIGKPKNRLYVCEGYATGASIHEATGEAVAVAFNAGNLKDVAKTLGAKLPDMKIVVAGDHDESEVGQRAAEEAAQAINGLIAIPTETGDWNDIHKKSGLTAVREGVSSVLAALQPGISGFSEWPEPGPIHSPLKAVPKFEPSLLPDALRDWVLDEADRMPCPPEFIAAAVIVELGSVIGARCGVKPKARDDWLIVPNLWGGIVGLPSSKKSPAIGAAMKPLDRLVSDAISEHQTDVSSYEADKIVFDARCDAKHTKIKKAAADESKGIQMLSDELQSLKRSAPEVPTIRRYKTNDTTIEKLGELLRENPQGVLVLRDELVGLLASWDREGREADRTFFLEAWNGNAGFDTDRIGRGSIFIPNLCTSILGGIQPDKLTVYLEQAAHALANDGMLQRFQVLVYPDSVKWEWRDRLPNKDARQAAYKIFDELADLNPEAYGASPADDFHKFRYFHFDDGALATYIEWTGELHRDRLAREDDPLIQQHLAKYDKLFPALALIFHLVECAATGGSGSITVDSALRAAAWCEFLEAHARRCYGLLADGGLRSAQALADRLRAGKPESGFTARDVRRNRWRYLTTDDAVRAALEWLEDEGWLRVEATSGRGGRPTLRYSVNPKVRNRR